MNYKRWVTTFLVLLILMFSFATATAQQTPIGTIFNYQGRLNDGATPANGFYDFQFSLYQVATGGSSYPPLVKENVSVTNGAFKVDLDFGSIFDGRSLYLEVAVRLGNSTNAFTTLSPRQALNPVPYALYADHTNSLSATDGDPLKPVYVDADGMLHIRDGSAGQGRIMLENQQSGQWAQFNRWTNRFEILASDAIEFAIKDVGATKMTIASNGFVGIGTVPAEALHVVGNRIRLQNGVKVLDLRTDGGDIDIETGTNSLFLRSANNNKIIMNPDATDGNVIIGMTGDQNARLAVNAVVPDFTRDPQLNDNLYGISGRVSFGFVPCLEPMPNPPPLCFWRHTTAGVYGETTAYGSSDSYGVWGRSSGGNAGVLGTCNPTPCKAGEFNGNVTISGSLSKAAGSFKIDHPLDPANRYLSHSFVESPDMMNIYNGNITLDTNGEAWVGMPAWFEALNQEFRYQLTAIGAPGPNLYIAQEIQGNRFRIAGGQPASKVSWQVTGIRHDAYAEAHRIPVEEEKTTAERGTYLHPTELDQPAELGLDYQRDQVSNQDVQISEITTNDSEGE